MCCNFKIKLGGLAHLARARHWQCRGDRFESGNLHLIKKRKLIGKLVSFFWDVRYKNKNHYVCSGLALPLGLEVGYPLINSLNVFILLVFHGFHFQCFTNIPLSQVFHGFPKTWRVMKFYTIGFVISICKPSAFQAMRLYISFIASLFLQVSA